MKLRAYFTLVIVVLLSACSSTPPAPTANTQFELTTPRYGHAAVTDGRYIYVIGGSAMGLMARGDIEIFDTITGQHQVLDNVVIPRRYSTAQYDQGRIYIFGGIHYNPELRHAENVVTVEVFDTKTHEVSTTKPMPFASRLVTSAKLNRDIYLVGGDLVASGRPMTTTMNLSFTIDNAHWSANPPMLDAKQTCAVSYQKKLYVVGGYNAEQKKQFSTLDMFDPQLGHWLRLPESPTAISANSCVVWQDYLLVMGNYDQLTDHFAYHFPTQTWQKLDWGYQASRHNKSVVIQDTLYVIGGNVKTSGQKAVPSVQTFNLKEKLKP